jgi:predicted DNA-binding protein (UPF0251 family)
MTPGYMNLQKLSPRHYVIMRYLLLGYSQKDTAEKLGISKQMVTDLYNSPLFRTEFDKRLARIMDVHAETAGKCEDPVRVEIEKAKVEAIRTNIELMRQAENERVRQASAWDILDRAGYKPKDVVEQTTRVVIDDKNAADIRAALADIADD